MHSKFVSKAIQLYQFDARKHRPSYVLLQKLMNVFGGGPNSADGGVNTSFAGKSQSHVEDEGDFEVGTPGVRFAVSEGERAQKVEPPADTQTFHPTARLQRLQERASRIGRVFFEDDKGMHTVAPLLGSLEV